MRLPCVAARVALDVQAIEETLVGFLSVCLQTSAGSFEARCLLAHACREEAADG